MQLDLGQPNVKYNSNIREVKIPAEMEHSVSTGHPYMDLIFAGDGIVPSTTTIVTGGPGAGKTTLMLQMADLITGTGNIALYNTGEENLYQIARHVKRLNLENGFIPAYQTCVDDIIEHMDLLRAENPGKTLFLIQDSVQVLEPSKFDPKTGELKKGRRAIGLRAEFSAVKTLVEYAKKNFIIILFINQMTKEGKFAGLNRVKHLIDCHLHLEWDTNRKSDTYGHRTAEMEKNRFGIAHQEFGFKITDVGVNFNPSEELDEVEVEEEVKYPSLADQLMADINIFSETA